MKIVAEKLSKYSNVDECDAPLFPNLGTKEGKQGSDFHFF